MRRTLAHGLAHRLALLAGVLPEGDRKILAGALLVVFFVALELFELRVDERVHRVDDDRADAVGRRTAQQIVEDRSDVGERLARTGTRGDDEVSPGSSELDGINLVPVERVALQDVCHRGMENSFGRGLDNGPGQLERRIELKQRLRPEPPLIKLFLDPGANRGIEDVEEASDVGGVVCDDLFVCL